MVSISLLFTVLVFGRLAFFRKRPALIAANLPPVSVILAARNESENLYNNLPKILEQDYPFFEVIIVNNQSTDDSAYLLSALQREYKNLYIIEVAKSHHLRPGKKLPLSLGIKAAKYEHFVFTDADCIPNSNQWLRKMGEKFVSGTEIVLGYGPYTKQEGFLNRLIRFDTAWIGVNYMSMALAHLPYMGVGRNLAYTKNVFNTVSGFKSHYSLASGDDDLFIQEAARNKNYTISLDSEGFCYSEPHTTWTGWLFQKSRHYSTSNRYNILKKMLLGVYPFATLLTFISFLCLVFNKEYYLFSASIFLGLTLIKWFIQGRCFMKLNEKSFVRFLPFWELFYAFLTPIIFYSTEKRGSGQW
jgi:glycosyltransferase involved in cell wall biosynthesis